MTDKMDEEIQSPHLTLKPASTHRRYIHDALHAAQLSGSLLFASLQQVTEDLGGVEKNFTSWIRLIHVEADCLCSLCLQ